MKKNQVPQDPEPDDIYGYQASLFLLFICIVAIAIGIVIGLILAFMNS